MSPNVEVCVEQLESFGLPDMFPEFMMPAAGAQLVRDCLKVRGMRKQDLMKMARSRGFRPTWKRLEHLGPGVYGFGLTIGGCVVPLMVRMVEAGCSVQASPTPTEQKSLF